MPVIPALRKQRLKDEKFKVEIFSNMATLRVVRETCVLVSKQNHETMHLSPGVLWEKS